jgi:hypothetical protein
MITTEEVRRDTLSAEQLAGREREVESRRRDLASQIHRLEKRAQELGVRLAALDPASEASAELEGEVDDVEEDLAWARYGLYQLVADAMAVVDEDGDTHYRYTGADVKAWCDRALEMGCGHPSFRSTTLMDLINLRQVPNAPFRERLAELLERNAGEEEGTIAHFTLSVAAALKQIEAERGQVYGSKHFVGPMDASGRRCPQNRQTEQLLGMRGKDNGRAGSLRLFIPYEVALAFMRALDMSPQQAGL